MKKLLLMLIIVLTTTFVKAQQLAVYHTNSVITSTYNPKLKEWIYDPETKVELSIILNESTVYINDKNNSRYVIDNEIEKRIEGDDLYFIIKGFDKNKKSVLIILNKNTITEKRTFSVHWMVGKEQRAVIYDIKEE
jgi:hypothetical protein